MAARSRQSKALQASSESKMTYSDFLERFPDNDTCLEYLKIKFYSDGTECPGCGKPSKFHKIKNRSCYSCQFCGHQVYPTAGTIFHKSTVNLQLWFYAIYLMSSTRLGISAKHLEREIGVSYKTAHRMFKLIRTLLDDEDEAPLEGDVEVDETLGGGNARAADSRKGRAFIQRSYRPQILGMVERGGRVRARVIENRGSVVLGREVSKHVSPDSMLYTDEWDGYKRVGKYYRGHRRINHLSKIYAVGDTHTNTIEGFWGLFKTGVKGAHRSISREYLQSYLNEWTFRYNHRDDDEPMFWTMLHQVDRASTSPQTR